MPPNHTDTEPSGDPFNNAAGATINHPEKMLKIDPLCEYCGAPNPRTIDRWMGDNGFPRPRYVNHVRYWRLSEVVAWWERQPKDGAIDNTRLRILDEGRKAASAKRRRSEMVG